MNTSLNFKRLCGLLAVGALGLIIAGPILNPAFAADRQNTAPFSWDGAYVGLHTGYGWNNADTTITPLPTASMFVNLAPQTQNPDSNGFLGGAQAGYNMQRGIFVVGGETDFSFTDMNGTKTVSPITQNDGTPFPGAGNNVKVHQGTDWFGTLRLRAGVAIVPKTLIYATGGLCYGHVKFSANTDFQPVGNEQYPASFSKTKLGWTAGAGAEFAITNKWSVKIEYLYYDLGSESVTANPILTNPPFQVGYKWETSANTANVGLNYRF